MEILAKCAAVGIFSTLASLLIKRSNPELSLAVSAAAIAAILIACLSLLQLFDSFVEEIGRILSSTAPELTPVIKCVGIAAVSRFAAALCRDASNTALAGAVETAGTLCAAAVALPSILTTLKMIGGLI